MNNLYRLLSLITPYYRLVSIGIVLTLCVTLANIGLLALAGWFITAMAITGLAHTSMDYFTPSAGIRGLAMIRIGGRYIERLVTHNTTLRLLAHLRVWFYEHLEPLAPARLQYFRGGDLLSRIRADIDTLDNFYLYVLSPSISAFIGVTLLSVFLAYFSWTIALINAVFLMLVGLGLPLVTKSLSTRPADQLVSARSDLRSSLVESIKGHGELRVYGATCLQTQKINHLTEDIIRPQQKLNGITGLSSGLASLLTYLSLWLALLIGIPRVSHQSLGGPDLAMIVLSVMAGFETVNDLPSAFQKLSETLAAASRIFDIIDAPPQVQDPVSPAPMPLKGDIKFRGVWMRYTPDADWALRDINLSIPAGQHIAVIGASGSGKSTLINLILRYWDYQEGHITLDQQNLDGYSCETVRRFCSVVSQHTHLFNTTIRNNLLLARPEANELELVHAAKLAQIHEEIMAMPDGFDTLAGETGVRLSGGQAQRIAIARALLKNAPLLILDEPTVGLDAEAEQHVLSAIENVMKDRSVLLITHHTTTLGKMDHIYVMDRGSIITHGTPTELDTTDGILQRYIQFN